MEIPDFFRESAWHELLLVVIIIAAAVAVSWLVAWLFRTVFKFFTKKSQTQLDDMLISALRQPIFLLVWLVGVNLALVSVNFLDDEQDVINNILTSAYILLAGYAVARTAGAAINWYALEVSRNTKSQLDDRLIPMVRRVTYVAALLIAVVMALSALGVNIIPVIAGLGIAGIAIALSLQPTMNHFIAGLFTVTEAGIGEGSHVLVDGQDGRVETIGWRTMKVRLATGDLIIVPNAKFADSTVKHFKDTAPPAPSPEDGKGAA